MPRPARPTLRRNPERGHPRRAGGGAPCRWSRCRRGSRASAIPRASCATCGASTPAACRSSAPRSSNPAPATLELEQYFDRQLGDDLSCWVCARVRAARPDAAHLGHRGDAPSTTAWQRTLLKLIAPVLRFAVRQMLGVSPSRAAKALERTRESFARVDAMLADGRRYLMGGTLTFVDLTFASLAALAVLPTDQGRSLAGRRVSMRTSTPVALGLVEEFRARPAGQFVLRLYGGHLSTARPRRRSCRFLRLELLLRAPLAAVLLLGRSTHPACQFDSSSDDGSQTRARRMPRSTAASNRLGYQRCHSGNTCST